MRLRFSLVALFLVLTVICVAFAVARAFGFGTLYGLAPLCAFGLSPPRTRWLITAVVMVALLISGAVLYCEVLSIVGFASFALFSIVFWTAEIAVWLIIAHLTGEGREGTVETEIEIPRLPRKGQNADDKDRQLS